MTQEFSEEELRQVLKSFQEGLQLYDNTLKLKQTKKIKSSKVEDPLEELVKISKLIFAHGTKLGIVFKTPVAVSAAYKQVREVSEVMLLLMSLVGQLDSEKYSELFTSEVIFLIRKLIQSIDAFIAEVLLLDFKDEGKGGADGAKEETEGAEGRLIGVGKIWENCNNLEKTVNLKPVGLLSIKIRQSISMVNDGIGEVEEWIEDPCSSEDPFGINDDFDDAFDEEQQEQEQQEKSEIEPELVDYITEWNKKLKLIKLLYSSFIKSLPSAETIAGKEIDLLNRLQNELIVSIDEFVSTIFLISEKSDITEFTDKINSNVKSIVAKLEQLNEEESKLKWLKSWNEKYSN